MNKKETTEELVNISLDVVLCKYAVEAMGEGKNSTPKDRYCGV